MALIGGKYKVIKELGEGAVGAVYLVEHQELGVRYALKLLHRELSRDQTTIERFKREASALEKLTHKGCVGLRDFGRTESGAYYMTMEYVEGISLHALIEQEAPLPAERVLRIAHALLDGLAAAHAVGIVHRDIKPDNIVIQRDEDGNESVKILDFGVAKLKERNDSNLTVTGISIGTPVYMAPEQAAGESIDHRVDLYAAGVVMYELCAGRPPFKGSTMTQTLIKHLTEPPAPFEAELGIAPVLQQLIFRALEKDPGKRFTTALEFRTAIEKLADSVPSVVPIVVDSAPEPHSTGTPGRVRILCIDDSTMILDILTHILQREGYEVFATADISTIHRFLFQEKVDLIITDVQMPAISGTKVCKLVKEALPEMPILLFSNLDDSELQRLSVQSDADGWMSKNAKPESWLRSVQSLLAAKTVGTHLPN